MSGKPLTPPDREKCQTEERSFMTLGPGMNRCTAKPVVIVHELIPQEDGQCGSMSMCARHLKVFAEQMNMATYRLEELE